jgi:hypothetical protein
MLKLLIYILGMKHCCGTGMNCLNCQRLPSVVQFGRYLARHAVDRARLLCP